MDLDIKALKNNSLNIEGSAYFVNEIGGNNVVIPGPPTTLNLTPGDPLPSPVVVSTPPPPWGGQPVTAVDTDPNGNTPMRKFTYINLGPSFDFGPSLGLSTPLEIGSDIRYEQTSSSVGTLTSTWFLGSLRVGFFPGVDTTVAYSERDFNGTDEGINGTTLARYSYIYDPRDLGTYTVFKVNGYNKSFLASLAIEMTLNSHLYFDYGLISGTELVDFGPLQGTLNNQYIAGTYEIKW